MVTFEGLTGWCVEHSESHVLWVRLRAVREVLQLEKFCRSLQVLALQLTEVGQIFQRKHIVRMQYPNLVLFQELLHFVFLVESVHLPEWLYGTTGSHQKLV